MKKHPYVQQSSIPQAGRGVFAGKDVKKGDLIEKAPFIVVGGLDAQTEARKSLPLAIQNVIYVFDKEEQPTYFIAGGVGSFFCHRHPANAFYQVNWEEETISYYAQDDILEDEEIFISYCSTGEAHCEDPTCEKLFINKDGVWQTDCGFFGG